MGNGDIISPARFIVRICIDIISIILVLMPTIVLEFADIQPYNRGFFCDDESIRYPYYDDTISITIAATIGLVVSITVMVFSELLHFFHHKYIDEQLLPIQCTNSCSVPWCVSAWYKIVGIFLFGASVTQSITDIGKITIGRLRPNFIDVCRPDPRNFDCTNSDSLFIYITSFNCTGTNHPRIKDSRMSFPSGHSSFSVYCAVFTVFYLQARFNWRGSKLLKHFAQALCIYAAFYVCLSRISDNKHHWSDVLSGAIIGCFIASLTCIHISNLFTNYRQHSTARPDKGLHVPAVANGNSLMLETINGNPRINV